jgi:hypothetical protein
MIGLVFSGNCEKQKVVEVTKAFGSLGKEVCYGN